MIFRSELCSIPLLFMTVNDRRFDRKQEGAESLISKRECRHIELTVRVISNGESSVVISKRGDKSIISKRQFGLSLIKEESKNNL